MTEAHLGKCTTDVALIAGSPHHIETLMPLDIVTVLDLIAIPTRPVGPFHEEIRIEQTTDETSRDGREVEVPIENEEKGCRTGREISTGGEVVVRLEKSIEKELTLGTTVSRDEQSGSSATATMKFSRRHSTYLHDGALGSPVVKI